MNTPQTTCDVPALWLDHKNELRNFIFKRVKDNDITNDILQEVLLKVYNFCTSKTGVRNVRSWLFQIAQNTIIDMYRKQAKISTQTTLPELAEEDDNQAFKEALQYIQPMLDFLPKEYAEPLRLADIENMKQTDIAKQLNLTLAATKSRIRRARILLKAEFVTCCTFETDVNGTIICFEIKDSCKPLQKFKKDFLQ